MKARWLILLVVVALAVTGCDKLKLGGSSDSNASNSASTSTASNATPDNSGTPSQNAQNGEAPANTVGDPVDSGNDHDTEDQSSNDRRASARKSLGL
jgi:hypothetical protein